MTIKKKILLGFILMAAIGITLGVVGMVSSRTLNNMSKDLADLQNQYIGVGDIMSAHYRWRQGLTEAVMTGDKFTGALDPNTCALGSWLDSDDAKNVSDSVILSLLDRIIEPHNLIHHEAVYIVDRLSYGDYGEAEEHLTHVVLPATQEVLTILDDIESRYIDLIGAKTTLIEDTVTFAGSATIVMIIVAVIACAVLSWVITGNIVKPLIPLAVFMNKAGSTGDITLSKEDVETIEKISRVKDEIGKAISACSLFVGRITEIGEILTKVADGDLSADIKTLSDADVMGLALKNMINNLNLMFSDISAASSQVTSGASQVANSSQTLAQGSTEQAASVHQLSVSVNEITEKTRISATMAEDAASQSVVIREQAEKGNGYMHNLVEAVTEINEAGQSINKIIKVIDDIAFQTNILALNAAVEAARAGQHGKGFAVVAEEVRNLAAKSAGAAKDTASMIESTIERSNLGLAIATDTAASLKDIVEEIEQNVDVAQKIALIAEEQTGAISQINIGIDQVSQVIQQNSATAEESAATSEELSGQAASLQELISHFKLKTADNQRPLSPDAKPAVRITAMSDIPSYALTGSNGDFGKY